MERAKLRMAYFGYVKEQKTRGNVKKLLTTITLKDLGT